MQAWCQSSVGIFRVVCVDLPSSPSIGTDNIESKRSSKIMFYVFTHQLAIIEALLAMTKLIYLEVWYWIIFTQHEYTHIYIYIYI